MKPINYPTTTLCNPFAKGYSRLIIKREMCIVDEMTLSLKHLPLHDLQKNWHDTNLIDCEVAYCDTFALITGDASIPDDIWDQCDRMGKIVEVVYAVMAMPDAITSYPIHLGYFTEEYEANSFIDNISFHTGTYSRCWEISSLHLSQQAIDQLYQAIVLKKDYDNLMFNLFEFPSVDTSCIAVKLLATPWTDQLLTYQFDLTANQLRTLQREVGLPECFIDILHLAALADARIVVFDPLASPLQGLPIYEHL